MKTDDIKQHLRDRIVRAAGEGVTVAPLGKEAGFKPPLTPQQAWEVFRLGIEAEAFFSSPQDVEWTFKNGHFYVLQSRPITTGAGAGAGAGASSAQAPSNRVTINTNAVSMSIVLFDFFIDHSLFS